MFPSSASSRSRNSAPRVILRWKSVEVLSSASRSRRDSDDTSSMASRLPSNRTARSFLIPGGGIRLIPKGKEVEPIERSALQQRGQPLGIVSRVARQRGRALAPGELDSLGQALEMDGVPTVLVDAPQQVERALEQR